ncbi:MAG: major capsid protein [Alphaproteobacteria bacterium]
MTYAPGNVLPNLVDHASLLDPQGKVPTVAWMLAQANPILKDMIWQEANASTSHEVTLNTSLPQGTWRQDNQGVPASKGTYGKAKFGIGQITDYSQVDRTQARLMGNIEKYRWTMDQSHIEGIGQQIASAIFYSNEATTPAQITGFSPFYSSLETATLQTAKNVINAGGSGNSNTSIWRVDWGDHTCFGIYPKGSQAGLIYEDKGEFRQLYDQYGNGFEGYTSYFEWMLGLALMNWSYVGRICNIDTTTAGLAGTTPPDLNSLMIQLASKITTSPRRMFGITDVDAPGDPMPGTSPTWYCNRTGRAGLDIQAIRNPNVLISLTEYAGEPTEMWRGAPVRACDSILNTESPVS